MQVRRIIVSFFGKICFIKNISLGNLEQSLWLVGSGAAVSSCTMLSMAKKLFLFMHQLLARKVCYLVQYY